MAQDLTKQSRRELEAYVQLARTNIRRKKQEIAILEGTLAKVENELKRRRQSNSIVTKDKP